MRILIFGDSIVQGMWDSRGGWAQRLIGDFLAEQMKDLNVDVPYIFNLGFSGDTTKHLTQRLPHETEARFSLWSGDKNVVFVIAIGVNDAQLINGEPFSSPEQYVKDLAELYEVTQRYSNKVLFVGLTPVEDGHPFVKDGKHVYVTDRIWQFEQVLRSFVKEHNIPFVPLFEKMQEGIEGGVKLYTDGLHPNDAGHQLMYERVKPALAAQLNQWPAV